LLPAGRAGNAAGLTNRAPGRNGNRTHALRLGMVDRRHSGQGGDGRSVHGTQILPWNRAVSEVEVAGYAAIQTR
jgi:hypothetical protein